MPQPVSNLLTFATQPSTPTAPPSRSSQEDGESFHDALDRAKSKNSDGSDGDDKQSTKADANPRAHSSKKTNKKSVQKTDETEGKGKKKVGPKPAGEQAAADPHPEAPAEGQDQETAEQDDGHRKKSSDAKPVAAQPAAVVQIQSDPARPSQSSSTPNKKADADKASPEARAATNRAVVKPVGPRADVQGDGQAAGNSSTGGDTTTEQPQDAQDGKKRLAIQPKGSQEAGKSPSVDPAASAAVANDNGSTDGASAANSSAPAVRAAPKAVDDTLLKFVPPPNVLQAQGGTAPTHSATQPPDMPQQPPEVQFAQANHGPIVAGIQGRLLPNGGSMQMRLDPPELGEMHVRVEMRDGVMTASFETANDQTAKLLSHSLGDLKTALESQGVSVEKLHVSQPPKQQSPSGEGRQDSQGQSQGRAAQQEQQRREVMRRMWRKLMKGQDPLDLVA